MDYIYIRAWGQHQGMTARWIRDEIQKAHDDRVPHNVLYKRDDGLWATFAELQGLKRERVAEIAGKIQKLDNPLTRTIL